MGHPTCGLIRDGTVGRTKAAVPVRGQPLGGVASVREQKEMIAMRKGNVIGIGVLAAAVLLGRAPTAAWAADVQADLHRAYYLQHEEKKYEAAAALYAQLAEGSDTPAAVRDTARRELDRCRAAPTISVDLKFSCG